VVTVVSVELDPQMELILASPVALVGTQVVLVQEQLLKTILVVGVVLGLLHLLHLLQPPMVHTRTLLALTMLLLQT